MHATLRTSEQHIAAVGAIEKPDFGVRNWGSNLTAGNNVGKEQEEALMPKARKVPPACLDMKEC